MPDASNGFKLSLGRLNWHCHADFRAGRGAPALLPQLHFPPWRVRSPHPCTVHSKPTLNQSSIWRPPLCLAFSHRRDGICFPVSTLQCDLAKSATSPKHMGWRNQGSFVVSINVPRRVAWRSDEMLEKADHKIESLTAGAVGVLWRVPIWRVSKTNWHRLADRIVPQRPPGKRTDPC